MFYELSNFNKIKWLFKYKTPELIFGVMFLPLFILYLFICTGYYGVKNNNEVYYFKHIFDNVGIYIGGGKYNEVK